MKKFNEITSSQKTSCQTRKTCVSDSQFSGYWWFNFFLIISKCMRAYLNILLLLHSSLMVCVVKMPLKGEVGGCALNSHGNFIVDL